MIDHSPEVLSRQDKELVLQYAGVQDSVWLFNPGMLNINMYTFDMYLYVYIWLYVRVCDSVNVFLSNSLNFYFNPQLMFEEQVLITAQLLWFFGIIVLFVKK